MSESERGRNVDRRELERRIGEVKARALKARVERLVSSGAPIPEALLDEVRGSLDPMAHRLFFSGMIVTALHCALEGLSPDPNTPLPPALPATLLDVVRAYLGPEAREDDVDAYARAELAGNRERRAAATEWVARHSISNAIPSAIAAQLEHATVAAPEEGPNQCAQPAPVEPYVSRTGERPGGAGEDDGEPVSPPPNGQPRDPAEPRPASDTLAYAFALIFADWARAHRPDLRGVDLDNATLAAWKAGGRALVKRATFRDARRADERAREKEKQEARKRSREARKPRAA